MIVVVNGSESLTRDQSIHFSFISTFIMASNSATTATTAAAASASAPAAEAPKAAASSGKPKKGEVIEKRVVLGRASNNVAMGIVVCCLYIFLFLLYPYYHSYAAAVQYFVLIIDIFISFLFLNSKSLTPCIRCCCIILYLFITNRVFQMLVNHHSSMC